MTNIATTHDLDFDESGEKLFTSPQTSTETQALITEQQVLLSTAAAIALPPAKTTRWSDTVHAVGAWLSSAAKPPTKPVYPKRHMWLENGLMSREMGRL